MNLNKLFLNNCEDKQYEINQNKIDIIDKIKDYLPDEKPHYLMGVGTPADILGAVKRGIDMFDCVLPTRSGRTGLAFTWSGRINLKNHKYRSHYN